MKSETLIFKACDSQTAWCIKGMEVLPNTLQNRCLLTALTCRSQSETIVHSILNRKGLGGEGGGFGFAENGYDADGNPMAEDEVFVYSNFSSDDGEECMVSLDHFIDFLKSYLKHIQRLDLLDLVSRSFGS